MCLWINLCIIVFMSNAPKKLKSNIFQFTGKVVAPKWREDYEIPVFSLPFPATHVGPEKTHKYRLSPVKGMSLSKSANDGGENLAFMANLILGLATAEDQDLLEKDLREFTVKYGFGFLSSDDEDSWFKSINDWADQCRIEGVETEGFPS